MNEQQREQRGDDERGDETDHQRDPPVGRSIATSFADRHLSKRAGGVQDPGARVVDPRDAAELGGLLPDHLDPLLGGAACVEILIASETITITITAATAITTTPMAIPTTQPVDAAVSGVASSSSPSLTIANEPALVHGRNRVGAWG